MTQTNVGFNGTLAATDWAKHAPLMFNQGPCSGGPSEVRITQVAGSRAVQVSAGRFAGDGVVTILDAPEVVNLPTPTNGQWFLLVNQRVWATKVSTFEIRNGATTSATFGFLPPTAYPASLEVNPGTKADVPVAWLWANNSGTTVYWFPLLAPAEGDYAKHGTTAERDTYSGAVTSNAPVPWNRHWAQRQYPIWYNTDLSLLQTYQSSYDATSNPSGVGAAGWWPLSDITSPVPYGTESSLKNGGTMVGLGGGATGWARDTDGYYYRRGDGRTVRLDGDAFTMARGSVSVGSGTAANTVGDAASTDEVFNSDTSVFFTRTDSVVRVNVTGWYDVTATCKWNTDSGQTFVEITRNDTQGSALTAPIAADRRSETNSSNDASIAGTVYLAAGDYVKLKAWQNAGDTRTLGYRLLVTLKRPDNP